MMVVQTSTSNSRSQKRTMTRSSCRSSICPWATSTRASGTSSRGRRRPGGSCRPGCGRRRPARRAAARDGSRARPAPRRTPARGQHRLAVLGRGLDHRQVADAGDRHLQGARDRRRRHRQHVHRGPQLLEPLLLLTPKRCSSSTMTSPRSFHSHALAEQRVGADPRCRRCRRPARRGPALAALVGHEPAELLDLDREAGEALPEGLEVLLRQDRGGHEHRDLLAVEHRLAGGADGHLGLAEADVAGQQPVHRQRRLHVRLISSATVSWSWVSTCAKASSSSACIVPVGREGVAGRVHPGGVEADQLGGDVADGLADPVLGPLPLRAAEAHHARGLAALVAAIASTWSEGT
jgi:hypothetical protein